MSKKSTKPAGANIFAGAIEGLGDSVSAFFTDDEAQQFPVALDLIDMRPQIRTELEDEDNPCWNWRPASRQWRHQSDFSAKEGRAV